MNIYVCIRSITSNIYQHERTLAPFGAALLILFFPFFLTAQQSHQIELNGSRLRAPLDLTTGQSALQISRIDSGSYSVILTGQYDGEKNGYTVQAAPGQSILSAHLTGKSNTLQFEATQSVLTCSLMLKSRLLHLLPSNAMIAAAMTIGLNVSMRMPKWPTWPFRRASAHKAWCPIP